MEFATGYLIEEALSVDNIFVFLVLFTFFKVPAEYQHRVLFWGILGAVIMRAVFILAGAALLAKFHWIIYVFGGILVITGIKLFTQRDAEVNPEKQSGAAGVPPLHPICASTHGSGSWYRRERQAVRHAAARRARGRSS